MQRFLQYVCIAPWASRGLLQEIKVCFLLIEQLLQISGLWCTDIANSFAWFLLEAMHFLRSEFASSSHLRHPSCNFALSSSHSLGCGASRIQGNHSQWCSVNQMWRNAPALQKCAKAAYFLLCCRKSLQSFVLNGVDSFRFHAKILPIETRNAEYGSFK